ncbi:DUF1269 domain-containing protein [Haloferax sp. MBLA0076]|uniref:DUF1269 domain-containing protein n=2 Tax=Haloferacaceae TaxID=1644056 RepID=A0A6A8GKE7_9EURY|nr:DUF1269 domain-containing protein [Haloferax sp. CBA1148]KAB1189897.1 DUF1269 domain-containing protein [Haloferax sp. CBA1148]MRX23663.1 DUF1269 domain-containing protein [Haloferax litoreum]
MSSLVVLAFDTMEGAKGARDKLYDLQKQELIKLDDAAIVVRKENGKTKVDQAVSLVGTGALGGAFWGMLIGLLFLAPWLGLAVGAVTGALSGKFADYGIDDDFIKEVGDTIEPGHSALFLLVRESQSERVVPELEALAPKVLQTNLSPEQEDALREAFGQEPTAA